MIEAAARKKNGNFSRASLPKVEQIELLVETGWLRLEKRLRGHQSNSSRMHGTVTSIGLLISPRANAIIAKT